MRGETHELEDVLTARNDLDNEDDQNAMFEVAKNSHEDIEHEDELGNDLEDGHLP